MIAFIVVKLFHPNLKIIAVALLLTFLPYYWRYYFCKRNFICWIFNVPETNIHLLFFANGAIMIQMVQL